MEKDRDKRLEELKERIKFTNLGLNDTDLKLIFAYIDASYDLGEEVGEKQGKKEAVELIQSYLDVSKSELNIRTK